MKKFKKALSVILTLAILFSMTIPSVAAVDVKAEESKLAVSPIDFQAVESKIATAQSETVIHNEFGNVHYYWGENSFVVQDSSGYYLVEIDEDFNQFYVNGKAFDITRAKANEVTYPSDWVVLYDTETTFDVGNLPHSVVGGLLGSAIGGLFSGGTAAVVGAVSGALIGAFAGGVFPADYNLTVVFYMRYRVLEPGPPVILEYYESLGVYCGPTRNLYEMTLFYDNNTYERSYE